MMKLDNKPKTLAAIFFLAGIVCELGFHWLQRQLHDAKPPSPRYIRALINDCPAFTSVGSDTRRAESITQIGQSHDSGINTWVTFKWRWTSGDAAKDPTLHDSQSHLAYSAKTNQWSLYDLQTPEGKWIDNVCGGPE